MIRAFVSSFLALTLLWSNSHNYWHWHWYGKWFFLMCGWSFLVCYLIGQKTHWSVVPFITSTIISGLNQLQCFNVHVAYRLSKIKYDCKKETKHAQEMFEKLVDKHALKDEQGKIVPVKNGEKDIPGTFQIPEANNDAWNTRVRRRAK